MDHTSTLDRKRLLELFPVTIIRSTWSEIKGSKSDICSAAAEGRAADELLKFVAQHLSTCKQHVYVFDRTDKTQLPKELFGAEGYFPNADTGIYVIRTTFTTLLRDPPEETTIDFLWPVAIELRDKYVVLRLVSLEKNLSSYFERPCYVADRSIDERNVLQSVYQNTGGITDLHKGIKKLWQEAVIDSPRAKYKKPKSMASEAMDEELGIREHNPELYLILAESVILNALFTVSDEEKMGVSHFSMNFNEGYLAFPSYSAEGGTDNVIKAILERNG
jgi:hypothetical protein